MKRAAGVVVAIAALGISACSGLMGSALEDGDGGSGAGSNASSSSSGEGSSISSSSSGDCGDCIDQSSGVGTDHPFDPDGNESDGVGLDGDGALVLDATQTNIPGIIWIANTNLNTVTKVDTTTYAILGRYNIGTNDPSRTSVNTKGDVFVGNRNGNSLTKVSADGQDCPDTNNDGVITTSTGFNDVLPYGQDDCVIWDVTVPNNPHIRGVAAQDVLVADPIPDDPDHAYLEHYVWVGGTNHRTIYKFDGDNGNLLIQTDSPTGIYGLALDGDGQLWMSGRTDGNNNVLGRLDTTKCVDQATCDTAAICTRDCTSGNCLCDPACPVDCDDAVKERILLPQTVYGVTVDFKQRVWLGGDVIHRYDPSLPPAQRYASVGGTGFIHGIAADASGWVWGAAGGNGVIRVDGDTLDKVTVPVANAKGMAIDKDGKVWAVEMGANAHVIEPGPGINNYNVVPAAVGGLGQCYTYSDMTGVQLALALNDPGYYREVLEGCPDGETDWAWLDWQVETPPGTSVIFRARSAQTNAELDQATWVKLAKIPIDQPQKAINAAFAGKGLSMGHFLELEVTLQGDVSGDQVVSPRVLSFSVSHSCREFAN